MFALCPPRLVLHLAGSQVHMHTHAWPCPRAQGTVAPRAVLLPPPPPPPHGDTGPSARPCGKRLLSLASEECPVVQPSCQGL